VTDAARSVDEDAPAGVRQGWVSLYAVAFVLLLVAGAILVVDSLGSLKSISLLWVSAGFSVAAIIFAVACVVAPRR
jgi:hypothetical protein